MRIAQIAPLWETIPPRSYGGTELIVHLLTKELVAMGHEVTLFAVGTSQTSASLEAVFDKPLRDLSQLYPLTKPDHAVSLYPGSPVSTLHELQVLERVFAASDRFDVIHNHLGCITLSFAVLSDMPVLTTLHGAFSSDTLYHQAEMQYYEAHAQLPYVSISNNQRIPCPLLNYQGTVYHGLDLNQYQASFNIADKNYLAFLGRFCEDKGPHLAIKAALETGWKLIMAGKIDCQEEKEYFREKIEPYVDNQQILYIGELNHPKKVRLLQNAAATLCPVTWSEPFGLVLIESMACGTPVIALKNGSIPEIVVHGKTGFVTESLEAFIACIGQINEIDRRACRTHVETLFSDYRMTCDYLRIYEQLIENKTKDKMPEVKSGFASQPDSLQSSASLFTKSNSRHRLIKTP